MKKTSAVPLLALASLLLGSGSPASAAGGYGHVEFANSGAPAAQADFLEGLAMLHDFEYESAAAEFRRAEAADPGFAMACWGEAMTYNHPIWMQQDRDAALAALKKLAPTPEARRARAKTEREKMYLDAVEILYGTGSKQERDFRYEAAMAKLHERYPDDVNAAAFYGLSILGTAHGGRDIPTYMRAAGVLEEAWVNHRDHPGLVHYLIHCYDDPAHAPLGLRAARIYAKIAPDAGHAQHMTSHIFLALGMWKECVDANIAAIADVDRVRKAAGKSPLCCGHYPSWLAYAYLQLGRTDEARRALGTCGGDLEAHTAEDHPGDAMDPDDSRSGSYANMRLRYAIDTRDWGGAEALGPAPASAGPGGRLDLAFARVLAEIGQGRRDAATRALDELGKAAGAVTDIETKQAGADPTYRVRPQIFLLEGRGLLAELNGDLPGAEKLLRQAVDLEQTLPIAFGPPEIDKPTHELLGEFLLRRHRYDEARTEFQKALARTPRRRLAEEGLAAAEAGLKRGG
jgi:tetratricopeptide (TPR) repeat protein